MATQSHEFGDATLDVETANRAEVGLHWHRGPLRLEASLYHLRYDDFIYLADTGIVAVIEAANRSRANGGEPVALGGG